MWITEERPPLRKGKIFVGDGGERATIAERLFLSSCLVGHDDLPEWMRLAALADVRLERHGDAVMHAAR